MSLEELIEIYWEFSDKAFDSKPYESTKGLIREAIELDEIVNDGSDVPELEIEEAVDVFFYLIYFIKRSGYKLEDFKKIALYKLEVLKTRTWKKDETGCYSHTK